jgi:selenocysteine lyase/cysteine desulfurase
VTWVHSMSGVKLPIRAIADALFERNRGRAEADRALLIVDGVHGFGIDPVTMGELGADMFIAGTHKWVFGPRGTGLVWGKPTAWRTIKPIIPPFEMQSHMQWIQKGTVAQDMPGGIQNSPGGFHSFEHRWALPAAFEFQDSIGRKSIGERVHELNRQLKEGLAKISGVELFTPMSDALSAGITCFMVKGVGPHEVVKRLGAKNFIASTTPYTNTYARLAPGLLNTTSEIEEVLAELRAMA